MMHQAILLSVLLGLTSATFVQDCGSAGTIVSAEIEDCELPPCVITRPNNKDVNITFTPGNEVTDLKTKIDAFIGGVHFPWPGPGGCELIVEGSCPLQVGEQYKYHAAMPVLAEYPSLSAVVTWKLVDQDDRDQVCIAFPIDIV
ncbi:NPC intracellular cholesterol transporter 2-like [Penaeus japonicus]|uniref:ML protein n=1 Tax=Penaeus japonicus TaxID=27405 RepID=A0A5B8HBT6_PENJP|nr:NPC intracellular cholesterol transporter 2-like [Penaeus japonicus]QDX01884.1 ML protein [Penaeus japonicus]